jgi:PhnB protein
MPVRSVPDGYHSLTPYLAVDGAADAIAFYKHAFGAVELMRVPHADGRIDHAEIQIGDSRLMLADEFSEMNFRGPKALGGASVNLMLYVDDVDAVFARAIEAGATVVRPVQNQFYGDRLGALLDPFGHSWSIATHIEDVGPGELQRRAALQHT